jgi:alkanesulfonate monooxygenase SsuD/methylene tetrahydromethanopterin reductase-like flavin-dependent oxidoreductase (luciferase family)
MDGVWSETEKFLVESRMSVAVVGGPDTVQRKLTRLVQETGADELIFTSDLYDHALRLRSFEIAADVLKHVRLPEPQRV